MNYTIRYNTVNTNCIIKSEVETILMFSFYLMANCVVAAISLRTVYSLNLTKCCRLLKMIEEFIEDFWLVFASYLGKPSESIVLWSQLPTRILLLLLFLFGNIVFISYKSSLTSEFSVRRYSLPFTSPEGFYNSKYG